MKYIIKPLISLICAFAFAIALTPASYAVDGCSSAAFKVATSINIEASVVGIAVADFNVDGHLDLAVSPNNESGHVIILLGRGGTERFGPPVNIPAGGRPIRMATGDFNGDNKPDLAVSLDDNPNSTLGSLSVLLGDGTGKFAAPILISLPNNSIQPVLADLNNDNKLDIVTALSDGTARVVVLLGNGAGQFTPTGNSPLATMSSSPDVVIGDFNEDGKRDLAIPANFSGVDIRFGDGTGAFGPPVNVATGPVTFWMRSGDFNNDGHLDLLVVDRMILGTGTGTFGAPIAVTIPQTTTVALTGDVNNDNNLDLVTAGVSGVTIMLGNGTGNLVRGKSYVSGFTLFGASSSFGALGDFNEDGKVDIAGVQRSGIGILDGDGTGEFNDALSLHAGGLNVRNVIAADFNNDGKQDFATTSVPGSFGFGAEGVLVGLGDGTGNFPTGTLIDFSFSVLSGITAVHLNSDGKLDLAVTRRSDGKVYFLVNNGNGTFLQTGALAPNVFVGFSAGAITAGDFNNDNKDDLIVMTPASNNFQVLLGDGNVGFSVHAGHSLSGSSSGTTSDLDAGDFSGDGILDLAIVLSNGNQVLVFKGDGTGHFLSYATLPTPGVPDSVVVRDLSGDAKPDIAVASSAISSILTQNYVTVFVNNGAQGFNASTDYAVDGGRSLGTGNFNDDNHPDLVLISGGFQANSNAFGISVLTNKGNGQFNAPLAITIADQSSHLAVGDFNNDSKDDVLLSQFSNSLALLFNNFTTALPCLSVNDVTITETDSGTTDAIFTIKLSAASAQTVRVNFFARPYFSFSSTVSPAAINADFEDVPGTVTFLPGETTKTISVPIKGDVIDELDQLFSVNLSTPLNAVITDGRGLGTIVDNDAAPAISVNDIVVTEGSSFSGSFTVTVSGPSEKTITVDYALAPGTASVGSDYGNDAGTLQFAPGTTSKTILVSIIQDNAFEQDETFFVNLSNPTNSTIADAQGQATITNDDSPPKITISSVFPTEGAQGTTTDATFQVALSTTSFQTIAVSYATSNGTALAGTDYVAASGSLTFNPGETVKMVPVQIIGDDIDEVNETFVVTLTNPVNATILIGQNSATILDDDGPTISVNSVSVTEGHTGFTNAVFTVTLSAPTVQSVIVNLTTSGGTATSGLDFQQIFSSTLFIPAGQTSTTATVRVFGDFQIEPDEQFTVTLQSPSNATIAPGQGTGTGTIVNDDSNGKLQLSSATFGANENAGNLVIQVNRVEGATGTVFVDFSTADGTATAGSDYTATSGQLQFNQGETAKAILVPITNDNVAESDETFSVTLTNPSGGAKFGTPSTAVITIKAAAPHLVLEDSAVDPTQVAAIDALLFLRDPFPVISTVDLFNSGADKNTRVLLFVTNLQLAPGETASAVTINLVDSNGQSYNVPAEDVRAIPLFDFVQVRFRLPDNLAAGICNLKIKYNDQESNQGTMRIKQ